MMRSAASSLVVALLVVGAVIAVPAVSGTNAVDAQESTPTDGDGGGNESITPGERFSGVVGVQEAEIDGDMQSRAFGIRVAKAEGDNARAAVVAERHQRNEQRLAELDGRLSDLERVRDNGSMSHGEYAARSAVVHSELRSVERSANETAEVADGVPNDTLEANGVNPEAIATLQNTAGEMGGPGVADLARSIAGPNIDRALPERTGPPKRGNKTTGTDRGADDRGPGDRGGTDAGGAGDRSKNGTAAGAADDTTTTAPEASDSAETEQPATESGGTADGSASGY